MSFNGEQVLLSLNWFASILRSTQEAERKQTSGLARNGPASCLGTKKLYTHADSTQNCGQAHRAAEDTPSFTCGNWCEVCSAAYLPVSFRNFQQNGKNESGLLPVDNRLSHISGPKPQEGNPPPFESCLQVYKPPNPVELHHAPCAQLWIGLRIESLREAAVFSWNRLTYRVYIRLDQHTKSLYLQLLERSVGRSSLQGFGILLKN